MVFENFMTFLNKVIFFTGLVSRENGFPRPLSKDDEIKYIIAFNSGDMAAKDILIKHNLRLVAHIVKKYNGAAEADDLIGVGTIGLIKAINTFKVDKGAQISTYAARCIENEILMHLRVNKKHIAVSSLNECLSSDTDGDDICLVDIITDNNQSAFEATEHKEIMAKLVTRIKKELTDREYKIMSLRYGIENNIALPQREVAKALGISRSYISRIEKHALEKIREICGGEDFKDAIN